MGGLGDSKQGEYMIEDPVSNCTLCVWDLKVMPLCCSIRLCARAEEDKAVNRKRSHNIDGFEPQAKD